VGGRKPVEPRNRDVARERQDRDIKGGMAFERKGRRLEETSGKKKTTTKYPRLPEASTSKRLSDTSSGLSKKNAAPARADAAAMELGTEKKKVSEGGCGG